MDVIDLYISLIRHFFWLFLVCMLTFEYLNLFITTLVVYWFSILQVWWRLELFHFKDWRPWKRLKHFAAECSEDYNCSCTVTANWLKRHDSGEVKLMSGKLKVYKVWNKEGIYTNVYSSIVKALNLFKMKSNSILYTVPSTLFCVFVFWIYVSENQYSMELVIHAVS